MLESMDAYEYWHRGTGMQIVSLIEAFTILAIMQIGIQQGRISVS
jgi:hypothetical protein